MNDELVITTDTVEVKTRELQAPWTVEDIEDIQVVHSGPGGKMKKELQRMLS